MKRSFAIMVFLAAAAPSIAQDKVDLMGEWVVRPFSWSSTGCRYHQWVEVERRLATNRYAGTAYWRHDCFGETGPVGSGPVMLTMRGDRVVISSPRPSWATETLKYRSPTRMEGRDALGHEMVYERPKGRPGV